MASKDNIINKIKGIFKAAAGSATPLAGLDIDPSSILSVEMTGSANAPKIKGISAAALKSGTIVEDQVQNPITFKESINRLKAQFPSMTPTIAITSPNRFVISKQVKIKSGLSDSQLNRIAWQEANKAFPGLADDLFLDFVPIEDSEGKSPSLLIIAARKRELNNRMHQLQESGISTKIIDLDCYALERAFSLLKKQLPEVDKESHVGMLNIDTSRMVLSVMQNDEITYCHQLNFNGESLTPHIKALLNLNTENKQPESAPLELSPTEKNLIFSNLQQLLQFFLSEKPTARLTTLVLSGRCALIPDLDKNIQERTGIQTLLANPFSSTEFMTTVESEKLAKQAPAYLLACGLAMRGL